MNGKQLKNAILQLAIQGKLVPQDPKDEPASVLIEKIRKEKDYLVKTKQIVLSKPEKGVKKIQFSEYTIPNNWVTCQLVDVCRAFGRIGFRGYTKNDLVSGPDFGAISLSPSNMKESGMEYVDCTYITWDKYEESPEIKIENGDILIVKTGSSYGKTVLVKNLPHKATINPQIAVIKDIKIDTEYLELFLQSPAARTKYEEFVLGTSIPTFSQLNLLSIEIPLPPLAEQKRIVEKIEELMPLVEEYDKAQKDLDDLNAKLPEALKKSILQQAIQGKLVPQDPNDEPASELLKRIRKEKEQLVKDGKLKKKDLETTPIPDDEKPFEIPDSWEWVRLSVVSEIIGGFAFPSQDIKSEIGTRVIRISDFNEQGWVNSKVARYNDRELLSQYELKIGDILIAMTGGTVGKSLYVKKLPERMLLNQRVAIVRNSYVLSSYIDLLIKAPLIQEVVKERKNSTNDNISMADITGFLIPLPPLAEQKRIVEKIEELFGLMKV